MRLYSNPASPCAPIFQYAPIFEQPLPPCHLSQAEKVIAPGLFGLQKWFTYQNVGNYICYRYMRLFSSFNEVQAPCAPIFDGRLLLGMSLFSKKYSNSKCWKLVFRAFPFMGMFDYYYITRALPLSRGPSQWSDYTATV